MWLITYMHPEMFFKTASLNFLLQTSIKWDYTPLCDRRCFFRLLICENPLLQTSQTWGFSPVCVLRWFFRSPFLENPLLQTLQTWSFSLACVERCSIRLPAFEKFFLPISQSWRFLLIRIWGWLSIVAYFTNKAFSFVCIGAYLGYLSLKIFYCIFHRYDAFHIKVTEGSTPEKILYCVSYKREVITSMCLMIVIKKKFSLKFLVVS